VILDDVRPSTNLTSVTAKAYEDETGFSNTWYLRAYAICADPVQGLTLAPPATSVLNSQNKGYTYAHCPTNRRALSVSGTINGGFGQVQMLASFVSNTHAAFFAAEDRTGFSGNWSQTTYAICAT